MTKNPESRNPNVSQGPRSGNAGTPAKRDRFIEMKSTGTKTALADEVMSALEARNPGGYRDPRPVQLPVHGLGDAGAFALLQAHRRQYLHHAPAL